MMATTGIIKFGTDSPGIFICGIEATGWAATVREAIDLASPNSVLQQELSTLLDLLEYAKNNPIPNKARLRLVYAYSDNPTHYDYRMMREIILDAAKDYFQRENIGMSKANVAELVGYLTIRMAELK